MTCSQAGDYECPYCGHDGTVADDFEINVGGSFDCEKCGKEIVVAEDEEVRYWYLSTRADYDAEQARCEAERARQIAWLRSVTAKPVEVKP